MDEEGNDGGKGIHSFCIRDPVNVKDIAQVLLELMRIVRKINE